MLSHPHGVGFNIELCAACGEKNKLNMLLHAHRCGFNMALCTECGEKLVSHTVSEAEKRCSGRSGLALDAVLWEF
jgi:hypothetical protein